MLINNSTTRTPRAARRRGALTAMYERIDENLQDDFVGFVEAPPATAVEPKPLRQGKLAPRHLHAGWFSRHLRLRH